MFLRLGEGSSHADACFLWINRIAPGAAGRYDSSARGEWFGVGGASSLFVLTKKPIKSGLHTVPFLNKSHQ